MPKKPSQGAKIVWKNDRRKVADLVPASYNPRQMTEGQAAELKRSLERFDLADPVVINSDGTIIGGHMRVRAMADIGVAECDVRVPSRKLSPREERELNLRLNKNVGEWDWDKLLAMDADLLKDAGWGEDELAKLLDPTVENAAGEVDEAGLGGGAGGPPGSHPTVCPSCGYNLSGTEE